MSDSPVCYGCLVNPSWQHKSCEFTTVEGYSLPTHRTSDDEKEIVHHLAEAWKKFLVMPNRSADDDREFTVRLARRTDPEVWRQPE